MTHSRFAEHADPSPLFVAVDTCMGEIARLRVRKVGLASAVDDRSEVPHCGAEVPLMVRPPVFSTS